MGLARSTYYDTPTRVVDETALVEAMFRIACQLSLKVPQGCHRNLPTLVIGQPVVVEWPGPTAAQRRV